MKKYIILLKNLLISLYIKLKGLFIKKQENEEKGSNTDVLQIKCKESEPDPNDPWKDDVLDRKKCADKLTEIISGQINPLTISLNGDWGTGKTFLLKRWKLQLEHDGYKAVYFNAWEDDFLNDPLLSILGKLKSVINEKYINEFKKTSKVIWTFSKNGLIRYATLGFGDPNELQYEKDIYDVYEELKNSKSELNNVIQKIILKYTDSKYPIIFIIDELDRCRPTYAIEVLERIKHFFNIDNVIFVLGVARKELEKTIKSVYGDIDIQSYLHRFIDIEFMLPYCDNSKFLENLFINSNLKNFNNYNQFISITLYIKEHFKTILLWNNFTFREVEQCFKLYILILKLLKDIENNYILLLLLIIIKIKNNNLYFKLLNKKSSYSEICNFLIPEKDYYSNNDLKTIKLINYNAICLFYNILLFEKMYYGIKDMIESIRENKDVSNNEYAPNFIKNFIGNKL